jgi:superfamily II DNA/RNA helicase
LDNNFHQVVIPDLWQQQAVTALREGCDVVVHAPTGAGKTFIFELWSKQGKNRGQAIYTVPTRALANDKMAEWRARGWDVGIATGDLSDNLSAPIIVATLETQKNRLIRGDGPALLVVDEYQMIGDADRGLNYELALALAPPQTQLLLLSGSVENPQQVVKWLQRLGRKAVLVRHELRPVPLEEVYVNNLSYHVPNDIRGYWPRLAAKALAEDLGPILIFSPRRHAAEALASELSRMLPTPNPLSLSPEQKLLVGDSLARMLKTRITYHHSGLSYAARAGVIEPLAKAGQLRIVVATMGLAAGINFSLRSVALAGESYRRDGQEQPLRADEILQMFGRAGRRGLDETGYVLVTANQLRLLDAHPAHLSRGGLVDWNALLGLMSVAADQGREPFPEAVRVQERLFTTKPITLGVEESMKAPHVPCALQTDAERARHVRKRVREMLNSRGEWQGYPGAVEKPLKEIFAVEKGPVDVVLPTPPRLRPALCEPEAVEKVGAGALCVIGQHNVEQASSLLLPTDGKRDAPGVANAPGGSKQNVSACDSNVEQASSLLLPTDGKCDAPGVANALEGTRSDNSRVKQLASMTGGICSTLSIYGRGMTVADVLQDERVFLAKWVRRLINWTGRHATMELWECKIVPLLGKKLAEQKLKVARFVREKHRIVAQISLEDALLRVPVDSHGVALWKPMEREVLPSDCELCEQKSVCRRLSAATGVALLWRRMGLVDAQGAPTRRGRIASFFSQGDGLAVAAALEESRYPIGDLIYDLANLDASFRFCGEENRWAGRLAMACQKTYGPQSVPGYLEAGVPIQYGSGAEAVVAAVHKNPASKHAWTTPVLGEGDIDRMIIEWRSTLRQIAHAPDLDWSRWRELQTAAKLILNETESPTMTTLPPLEFHQTRRMDHKLILRRH